MAEGKKSDNNNSKKIYLLYLSQMISSIFTTRMVFSQEG